MSLRCARISGPSPRDIVLTALLTPAPYFLPFCSAPLAATRAPRLPAACPLAATSVSRTILLLASVVRQPLRRCLSLPLLGRAVIPLPLALAAAGWFELRWRAVRPFALVAAGWHELRIRIRCDKKK